jgi:hypothetical protein
MATLTAQAMVYHVRAENTLEEEDTSYTTGTRYNIRIARVRAKNEWKIKERDIKVLCRIGDKAVLHGRKGREKNRRCR